MDNLVNLLPATPAAVQPGSQSGLSAGKGIGQAFAGFLTSAAGENDGQILSGNTAGLGLTQLALLNQLPLQDASAKKLPEETAATSDEGIDNGGALMEQDGSSHEEITALLSQFFPVVGTALPPTVNQSQNTGGAEVVSDRQPNLQQNQDLVKLLQMLNSVPADQTSNQDLSQSLSLSQKGMENLSLDMASNRQFSDFSRQIQELLRSTVQQQTIALSQQSVSSTATTDTKKIPVSQMNVQMSQMLQNAMPVQRELLPEADQSLNASEPGVETVSVINVVSNTAADGQNDTKGFAMLNQKTNLSEEVVVANQDNQTATNFAGILDLRNSAKQSVNHGAVHSATRQTVSDPYDVAGQIVERAILIKQPFQADSSEMVIKLKPEHLGELTLRVAVDNGQVSASFHSNNAEVRSIIENSLAQLKQDMSNQGLKVDNVGVYAGLSQFHSGEHQQTSQQQPVMKFKNKKVEEEMVATIEEAQVNQLESDSGVNYLI